MRPRKTEEERFWTKVNRSGPLIEARPDLGPCYLWTASVDTYGYGHFRRSPDNGGKIILAFKWRWIQVNGPIPAGLEPDHLCHTLDLTCRGGNCIHRLCVNDTHIELVTHKENAQRGRAGAHLAERTECPQGHPYDEENTHIAPTGQRVCRACKREQMRLRRASA